MNTILTLASAVSTSSAEQVGESVQEIALYGLKMTAIGMGIVFAVLILLWTILAIMHKIFEAAGTQESKAATSAVQNTAPQVQSAHPVSTPASDNGAIIAAITAAITTYRQQNGQDGNFRVVSFKRR